MAKVASQSWVQAVKSEYGAGEEPIHSHFAVAANLDRFKEALTGPGLRKTIVNNVVGNAVVRAGVRAGRLLASERQSGRKVKVLTGMRDPVARSISLFMFHVDFYGDVAHPRGAEAGADTLMEALRNCWTTVLENAEPGSTFEWLNWYTIGLYRTWFASELLAAFDIDVCKARFLREEGVQIQAGTFADALFYRVEDMPPSASSHHSLLKRAGEFFGAPLGSLPVVNASLDRRSQALSRTIRERFRLPPVMLDAIYGEPAVRHFYSDEEIGAFKHRWSMV
jgi:hypothetical protein